MAGSRQLIEQTLRFFQIGGVEALGEPTVDGGEQIMSLGPPALLAPQPSEARRRAQLIGLGTLLPRDRFALGRSRSSGFPRSAAHQAGRRLRQ